MRKLILSLSFLFYVVSSFATHNRAGEITYTHVSGLTYEITATIFADPTSSAISRRELEISWGDNSARDSILNSPPDQIIVPNRVIKRIWKAQHTFPGPGDYIISVTDRNRNGGVDNISNSSSVPFYVASTLRILPISGVVNNSVFLTNDPIDDACIGERFIHNTGAVDPDGDSLAYFISESFGSDGTLAPGFTFPSASNSLYVNPITGDLIWDTPVNPGLYNIAIRIEEYRSGVFLGSVLRDLQIQVFVGCNNFPPTIGFNRAVCLEAGTILNSTIQGNDRNLEDDVELSYTGEIFTRDIVVNTAFINSGIISNPTNDLLIWNTTCDDIRKTPFDFNVKATDNGSSRNVPSLTTFENGTIQVIGPAIENFQALPNGKVIDLSWDVSTCSNSLGYNIYRKIDSSKFIPNSCQYGVPDELGFSRIAAIRDINTTSYTDSDESNGLVPGQIYCYLITAVFQDNYEGYASQEVCAKVEKFNPVMTEVSILETLDSDGEISVSWSPPDTISPNFPAPYRYLIFQQGIENPILKDSIEGLGSASLLIDGLNTLDNQFKFRVQLLSLGNGRQIVGESSWASSIRLDLLPLDNQVVLNWTENVPWTNNSYSIYRSKVNSAIFDSIGTSISTTFTDVNLNNGTNYCYYVRSSGKYNLASVSSVLFNNSQVNCATPIDNEPPCGPVFSITSDCNLDNLELTWNNPNKTCPELDVVGYSVYRSITESSELNLLESILDPTDTSLLLQLNSIAGCYLVRAIDSVGNESINTNRTCVDYCPIYELPNIFTPNGDGKNDYFIPLKNPKYRYVESIDLNIYNRWGELVFKTDDPDINWDGIHMYEKKLLTDGVYFYTCIVNEISLSGIKPRLLKGVVNIQDGKLNSNK